MGDAAVADTVGVESNSYGSINALVTVLSAHSVSTSWPWSNAARVGARRLPTRAAAGRPVIVRRLGRGRGQSADHRPPGGLGCREGGGNPTRVGAVETHQMRRDRRHYEVDIEVRPGLPGCVTPIPGGVGACSSAPFRPVGWPYLA